MSTVPTTKWEANLHGANFWIHGCGGHSKVLQNTGLRIWMLELLYDKYCAPFDIPRVTLFYTCVWLKHYPHDALLPRYQPLHLPKIGVFAAKRHVRRGLQHLSLVMTEVSMQHLQHKASCNFLLQYFELGCPLNHPHNYGQMLFDMTMQTPPLLAFAKPFAIFFFSISNLDAP